MCCGTLPYHLSLTAHSRLMSFWRFSFSAHHLFPYIVYSSSVVFCFCLRSNCIDYSTFPPSDCVLRITFGFRFNGNVICSVSMIFSPSSSRCVTKSNNFVVVDDVIIHNSCDKQLVTESLLKSLHEVTLFLELFPASSQEYHREGVRVLPCVGVPDWLATLKCVRDCV